MHGQDGPAIIQAQKRSRFGEEKQQSSLHAAQHSRRVQEWQLQGALVAEAACWAEERAWQKAVVFAQPIKPRPYSSLRMPCFSS